MYNEDIMNILCCLNICLYDGTTGTTNYSKDLLLQFKNFVTFIITTP
jgi:hypothetical protein